MTGSLSKLKRREGLEVHRRAVELARDPDSAGTPELMELARDLRKRFIARRIFDVEKV